MFRIFSFVSRLGVRRSQSTLGGAHSFHKTATIRAQDNTLYSQILEDLQDNTGELAEKAPKRRSPRKSVPKPETQEPKRADTGAKTSRSVKAGKEKSTADRTVTTEHVEPEPKRRRASKTVKLTTGRQKKPRAEIRKPKKPILRNLPESLIQDPWKNVEEYLSICYGINTNNPPIGDNKRINVINEALCDDVLERLEPTLEKHVGCDIIDINPGTCLWSSKLHSRLKPRKHILLEPDVELYRPFIQPLLDETDSKYEWIPKSGVVWGHLEPVLSKDYLPFQEAYDSNDPRLEQPNDTLLVIASIGYYPKKRFRGFESLSTLVLYQFMSAIRTHSLFERYGKVRILVWTADDQRRHILPKELFTRRKSAVEAEISCERIEEVASSTNDPTLLRKDRQLDLEKVQTLLESMEAAGIKTPAGRESILLQELLTDPSKKDAATQELVPPHDWFLAELGEMEAKFAAGAFSKYTDEEGGTGDVRLTAEYKRLKHLGYWKKYRAQKKDRWNTLVVINDNMIVAEKEFHAARVAGIATEEKEEAMRKTRQDWNIALENLPSEQDAIQAQYICDARRTFKQDPPLLLWHRRETEPLRVRPEEFFPKHEMCLLDFHPGSLWPVLRDNKENNYDIFEYIVGHMFILPGQSTKRALTALYPGAYEWIIDECPSLMDPSRGGALDLDTMNVKCITLEHLREIIEAWVKWPFKPNKFELLARIGSNIYDEDASDVNETFQ